MTNIIGLKELREQTSPLLERIQNGETLIVMKHSKPLFKISPIEEDGWETVIDFTKFKKGGITAQDLITRLQ